MKNILNFFLEVNKLKEMPRTGWVLRGMENPETTAEHAFRVAILVWLLARKKNLNIKKAIEIALSHDLCEVYTGDVPPFFYYVRSPDAKWVRLSQKEKEKRGKKKFETERNSILKLTKFLDSELQKKILNSWLNYGKRSVKEGNFAKQAHRIETLIQSIEYFGPRDEIAGTTWWEFTEEIIDDPLLLDFLKVIQKKFYGKVVGEYKKDKGLENILDFISEINKLKRLPRTLWVLMGVKNPETVAGHIFTTSLMAWIFGQERKELNLEKILKMALCHELPSVYTGDLITPFTLKEEKIKTFQKWPRLLRTEKRRKFLEDYQKEKRALKKVTSKLEKPLREEIIGLFDEYKMATTPEGRFVNQINVLAVLFQAIQYQKKYKNLPIDWMWEWTFEKCESPICFEFIEELKKKFY